MPKLTIIIPTHNRPLLLPRAVNSALAQSNQDIAVIVVDDASDPPAQLSPNPKLKIIRLENSRGAAAARNVGTKAAKTRWVTYLDDDDRLLPHMAAVSLKALEETIVDPPFAMLSGLKKIDDQGNEISVRRPPPIRQKGSHFYLEEVESGCSYHTKQTLVVEREIVLDIGGWDESFQSRTHSEFFLRLNPACTIIGIPEVTYLFYVHKGNRISGNTERRNRGFRQLIDKHRDIFESHPKMYSAFVFEHVKRTYSMGMYKESLIQFFRAWNISPPHVTELTINFFLRAVSRNI